MPESEDEKIAAAAAAEKEIAAQYVHDASPRVIRALLANPRVAEEEVLVVAGRKNLPPDILELIARDKRWTGSYPIRLALATNPKAPLSVSLSIARFLRLFDLEEITRNRFIPLVFRHKVEAMISERIPAMPLGNKKTLAKRAAGNVLFRLLQDRSAEVVGLCLNNPNLAESHIFKLVSREATSRETIEMIARHPNWSCRPLVQFSLARNGQMPLSLSVPFLGRMRLNDLRELYADPALPVTIRPFVHQELLARGKAPGQAQVEEIYEIVDEELDAIDAEIARYEVTEEDRGKREPPNDDEGDPETDQPG